MQQKKQGRFHFKKKEDKSDSFYPDETLSKSSKSNRIVFDINDRDHFLKSIQQRKHEQRVVTKTLQRLSEKRKLKEERSLKKEIENERIEKSGVLELKAKRDEIHSMATNIEPEKKSFRLEHNDDSLLSHVEVDIQPISLRNDAYYASSSDEDIETPEERQAREEEEKRKIEEDKKERFELLPEHLKKIYGIKKLDLDHKKLVHLIQAEKKMKQKERDDKNKSKHVSSRTKTKSLKKHIKGHENKMKKIRKRMKDDDGPPKKRKKV